MLINLFTYDCRHRKTVDILLELIINGFRISKVYAAPLIELDLREDIIKLSASNCYTIHTRDICNKFNIPYIVMPHKDVGAGELGIIGGARILPKEVIDKYSIGIINIHPGLLPENRGLDNIKWALYHDIPQGLTVHFINEYVDRGRIILQEELPVFEDDKIYHIHQRLVSRQPKILREALEKFEQTDIYARGYPAVEKGTLFKQMTDKEETDLITKCSNRF